LRPSGNAGALVSKLSGFIEYQNHQAWNWERLALTRARVVAGDADLSARVMAAIGESLSTARKRDSLAPDISDMREKLLTHQPQRGPFDIRRGKGGLVELEFACQTLQLAHCAQDARLIGVRDLPTLIHDLHDGGFLSDADYGSAHAAAQCFATLRQIASLCLQDDETTPAPAIQNFLLEALNEPDMARLRDSLAMHRRHIDDILTRVLAAL
jgi:glutamate-ammonia-ligase adenylyltransferase